MSYSYFSNDPRLYAIPERLKNVDYVIPVLSPKGGVGKTVVSAALALALSELGFKVGVLDLDLTNPSQHILFNVDLHKIPEEDKGVKPPQYFGVKLMSVAFYSRGNPLPLRGWEATNVIREVLAITVWGTLNYLIIDTPPGLTDPILEVLTLVKGLKPLVVTTSSQLSINALKTILTILKELNIETLGVIENMSVEPSEAVRNICRMFEVRYLSNIPYEQGLDKSLSVPEFRRTKFYSIIRNLITELSRDLIQRVS